MTDAAYTRDDIAALLDDGPEYGPVQRALAAATTAWGYDYRAPAAKLRENDAIVRRTASAALAAAATRAAELERAYKAERVPPISREAPYPTATAKAAMAAARRIAELARGLAGRIDALEAPAADSRSRRFRDEAVTLRDLIAADIELVLAAQRIRDAVNRLDLDALEHAGASLTADVFAALARIVDERNALLVG